MSQVPNEGKPFSVADIFKLNLERETFRANVAEHWNATYERTKSGRPIDAILSPVAPTLAPPHDTTCWWGYTAYWNLMDYSAAVFPVGQFDANSYSETTGSGDTSPTSSPPSNEEVAGQWVPQTYHGAPISLQLVGRRLNEEKVLGMLNIVEGAMKSAGSA